MNSPPRPYPKPAWISNLVLGSGFALTGAGTVTLGVLLPVLSTRWALRDQAAGFLFFLQFLGSTLGAVLTGSNRMRPLRLGYALLTASACALAYSGRNLAFLFFFFFGLGLGLAMTATSLVISDRYGKDRARKLERINFAWSCGATAAPVLIIHLLDAAGYRPLFFVFAASFLCVLAWTAGFERETVKATPTAGHERLSEAAAARMNRAPLNSLLPLLALAMGSVGVETALSGWLTTYFHRSASTGLASAAVTTTLFLLGIVLSRLAFSTRLLTAIGLRNSLHMLLWSMAAAVILLIAATNPLLIRTAAGLAGICIGPLYPLVLSFLLERADRGWIFAAGGIGSVVFPWLTGLFSSSFGSLRMGMVAPLGAAVLMLLLLPLCFRTPRMAAIDRTRT